MKPTFHTLRGKLTRLIAFLFVLGLSFGPTSVVETYANDKIKICHATGSQNNPWVLLSVDENGLNGHGDHPGDIIPATDTNGDGEITKVDCGPAHENGGHDHEEDEDEECDNPAGCPEDEDEECDNPAGCPEDEDEECDNPAGCPEDEDPEMVIVCQATGDEDNPWVLVPVPNGPGVVPATDTNGVDGITVEDCGDQPDDGGGDHPGDLEGKKPLCHFENPDGDKKDPFNWQVLWLPQAGIDAHLEQHDEDALATDANGDGEINEEDCVTPDEPHDGGGDGGEDPGDECEGQEVCPDDGGGNGGNNDAAQVCEIEGNTFTILDFNSLAEAQAHVDADLPELNDFIIDDNDNVDTNNTEDCQPPHDGGGNGGGNPNDGGGNGGGNPNNGGGGGGINDGGNGGGGNNPDLDLASDPNQCPEDGFKDYGYANDEEYNRAVTTWVRCQDVAHGLTDNNIYYSPTEAIQYSHFVKMLMRASGTADWKHVLGSDVTQYFDLAVKKEVLKESDRSKLQTKITLVEAEAMTTKVLGKVVEFTENRADGLLGRKSSAENLFELFAK